MTPFLEYRKEGAVAVLTMNEPATRNALSGNAAVDEFVEACARIDRDDTIRAVVITGRDPAFSAGGNLQTMRADWRDRREAVAVRLSLRSGVQRLSLSLHAIEVPLIAAVNGPAIGGGCDLACLCDIRLASHRASFSASFVKLGLVPALGGAWLLPRIVGPSRAAEMCLTGEVLHADEALACGLVSRVIQHGLLMDAAMALASTIASRPAHAVRMTKNLLRSSAASSLSDHLDKAAPMQALVLHSGAHEDAWRALGNSQRQVGKGDMK